MSEKSIHWGIIGCGDVCEIKSGPAFSKIEGSQLKAVMRRDKEEAADFARRHYVDEYYDNADEIIHHKDIQAVYIATPPLYHEEYAIKAIEAGKHVYIEKPVTLNAKAATAILNRLQQSDVKVTVAHYRRKLPLFVRVKQLVGEKAIGKVRLVKINLVQENSGDLIANSDENWRENPEVSGGGLFHDLAPHQLDIVCWMFGEPVNYFGSGLNQLGLSKAHDITSVEAVFNNRVYFLGSWIFHAPHHMQHDECLIIGEKGYLKFSFFRKNELEIGVGNQISFEKFENPENIQLPMIHDVVRYFNGQGENPCSLEDALVSLKMMDATV